MVGDGLEPRRRRWGLALLVVCSVLPFLSTRHFAHVHDDHDLRGPTSLVASEAALDVLWQSDLFGTAEEPVGPSGFWRPLILLSFRIEHRLTNGARVPFAWLGHVNNLLLHALATVGLLALLTALGLAWWPAWIAAALFGVHPVHTESVAWISGRSDVAATALAFWSLALACDPRRRESALALTAAGLLGVAALLCKESAVLLIGLSAPLASARGVSRRRAWGLPVAAVMTVLLLLTVLLLRTWLFKYVVGADAYLGPEDLATRWRTWASILPELVRLQLWPGVATPIHPVPAVLRWGDPAMLVGAVLALTALAGVVVAWRRALVVPLFGLGVLAGTLWMVAPWVRFPTGYAEVAAPLYERYLYASCAGPVVLLVWWLRDSLVARPLVAGAAAVILIVTLGWAAHERCAPWADDEAFALAGLAQAPDSSDLWNHLGYARLVGVLESSDVAGASDGIEAFDRALALDPSHRLARLNRFLLLRLAGPSTLAEEGAGDLLRRYPDDPAVLDNVAGWHMGAGRWEFAAELLERAIATGGALPGAEQALAHCRQRLAEAAGR